MDNEQCININYLNFPEYLKYYLIKENCVFKFRVIKIENKIIIKCKRYIIHLTSSNFPKIAYNTIDIAYEYVIKLFEENKVFIQEIIYNKSIKLLLDSNFEILLEYKKEDNAKNKPKLIYNELKNEINKLKTEINLLKKEIKDLSNGNNKENKNIKVDVKENDILKNNSNQINIKFMNNIVKDSYTFNSFNNSFSEFKSVDDVIYIIYSNKNKSIISYNLIKNKKMAEIKNAHDKDISNIRYCLDKINKRDLIISVSAEDNNIKLWNVKNFECLYNFKSINKNGFLYSACFIEDNNQNFIITSNCTWKGESEPLKVYDFSGNKIKEIKNNKDKVSFIDTYYDSKLSKSYIITGNEGHVKSYNYNSGNMYKIYCDNDKSEHDCVIINNFENVTKLIESSDDGNIRIWNFHTGKLLNKIKVCNDDLYTIYLWSNKYLFVSCGEKVINIIDLEKKTIVNKIKEHKNWVITMKKIYHPLYGECLISQDSGNGEIKLWTNEK